MTDFPKHEVSNIQRKQLWKKERFKAITKENQLATSCMSYCKERPPQLD
jgi:hypothetical protein